MALFDRAVTVILGLEGGYTPDDMGSPSNWGIRQANHAGVDVKTLTRAQAVEIYRHEYWERVSGDRLPPPVALAVFDAAVNQGPGWAKRALQTEVRVPADGIIGPETLAAIRARDPQHLTEAYLVRRALHYVDTAGWPQWGASWFHRLFRVHAVCLTL